MKSILTTITTTGIAQQITGSNTQFNTAVFFGYKNFNGAGGTPTNNGANVTVGIFSNSGQMFLIIPTGGSVSYNIGEKQFDDLSNFAVVGNASDGLYTITYP